MIKVTEEVAVSYQKQCLLDWVSKTAQRQGRKDVWLLK